MERKPLVVEIQVRIFATVFYVILQLIRMNMKEMIRDIGYSNMREMLKSCLLGVQERAKSTDLPGLSSGLEPLDNFTGGLEKGKVYVIGGRPGMGKDDLMLSMILDIILRSRCSVLLFSTNYMKQDYMQRLLSIHCNIPTTRLSQGFLEPHEWDRLDKNVETLANGDLFIHDSFDLPLNELIETARFCIRETGAKVIFIDCLQMIDLANDDGNTSERIKKVMCSLKQLACFLDVPIVAGAMLSREVEYREEAKIKHPQLMDMAIPCYAEILADVIMIVHRPEGNRIRSRDLQGKIELLLKKNNLRPLGNILLDYHQDTGVVSFGKKTIKSESKAAGLKELNTHNKAIKNLIETFKLEEDMPF